MVSSFQEGADFNTAMEVDPEFRLKVKGAEAGAGEVFAEHLLIFAKIYMIFLLSQLV